MARVLPRGSNGLMLLAGMLTHSATSGSIPRASKTRTGKRRWRSGDGSELPGLHAVERQLDVISGAGGEQARFRRLCTRFA
ncbi:hypothetical protein D3C84_535000 [compost metagenome]